VNVSFHALAGIAIAHETGGRLGEISAFPAPHGGPPSAARAWSTAFGLAVLSHGILDGLPHYYPLGTWLDAAVSTALVAIWLVRIRPVLRVPLLVMCLAAISPDIIDHVPRDLNRHLGLHLPELPKLFPWHWRTGSGSMPGTTGPLWRESMTNHGIVVAFCAVVIFRTRHLLSRQSVVP
jgi:hypothetical protein